MYTSSVTFHMQNQCATPNFWHSARNFLTGRVVQNWEAKVLIFVVATKVICAAVSLITGQLTFAMVFLLSAMFDAILRKKIIDFTNLHNASAKLYDTDLGLKLTKVQLDSRVDRLRKENKRFEKTLNNLAKEGENYAELNQAHLALIKSMEKETSFVKATALQLITNGTVANEKQVIEFQEHAKKLEHLSKTAAELQEHQKSGVKAFVDQFSSALNHFKSDRLQAAQELGRLKGEREGLEKERQKWEAERVKLQEEITRLHEDNKKLHALIDKLGQVVTDATQATGKNLESSTTLQNMITGISRLIYKKEFLQKHQPQVVIDTPTVAVAS